jgi:hypothetical protein
MERSLGKRVEMPVNEQWQCYAFYRKRVFREGPEGKSRKVKRYSTTSALKKGAREMTASDDGITGPERSPTCPVCLANRIASWAGRALYNRLAGTRALHGQFAIYTSKASLIPATVSFMECHSSPTSGRLLMAPL